MADENKLQVVLELIADQFKGSVKDAQGILADFLGTTKGQVAAAVTAFTALSGALLTAAAHTAEFAHEMELLSQKTGVSVDTLESWTLSLKEAGLGPDALALAMRKLSKEMVQAQDDSSEAAARFRALGVEVVNADGTLKDTETVLTDLAGGFARFRDGAEKSEAAVALLGRAGLNFIPLFNQGAEVIKANADRTRELGGVLTEVAQTSAVQAASAAKELAVAWTGFGLQLGAGVTPALRLIDQMLTSIVSAMTRTIEFVVDSSTKIVGAINAIIESLITLSFAVSTGFVFKSGGLDALADRLRQIRAQSEEIAATIDADRTAARTGSGERKTDSRPAVPSVKLPAPEDLSQFKLMGEAAREARDKFNEEYTKFLKGIEDADKADFAIRSEANKEYYDSLKAFYEKFYAEIEAADKADYQIRIQAEQQYNDQLKKDLQTSADEGARVQENLGKAIVFNSQQAFEASRTFFDRWNAGLDQFLKDSSTGFGSATQLAVNMARDIQTGWRTFFFDWFTGRIQSLSDALRAVGLVAARVLSDAAASLATSATLSGLKAAGTGIQNLLKDSGIGNAISDAVSGVKNLLGFGDATVKTAADTEFGTAVTGFTADVTDWTASLVDWDASLVDFGGALVGLDAAAVALNEAAGALTASAISSDVGGAVGGVGGFFDDVFGFEHGGDLAFAARGWDIPSAAGGLDGKGGSLAILHPREMVLPADIADPLRTALRGGGGGASSGGDTHIHITAVDAKSFTALLQDSKSELFRIITQGHRDFQLRSSP